MDFQQTLCHLLTKEVCDKRSDRKIGNQKNNWAKRD